MDFKEGDRVIVRSEQFASQNGLTGTVIAVRSPPFSLSLRIKYDGGQHDHPYFSGEPSEGRTNSYNKTDLSLISHNLVDPEMDLDEIHKAQEIMEGLK